MANVGTLGNITFSASSRQVNTFDNMTWNNSARYASHDRHLRSTLLEFVGTAAGTIPFTMYFSAFLGVNPDKEIAKVIIAMRTGQAMRLVIGRRAYGRHKWVVTKATAGLKRFDKEGNLIVASMNVTLEEYLTRRH